MITPEQRSSLPTTKPFTDALQALVEGVNGFPYAGDRLEALMDVVCWLREHPDTVAALFGVGAPPHQHVP